MSRGVIIFTKKSIIRSQILFAVKEPDMDLSGLLAQYQPEAKALRKFGFRKNKGVYTWTKDLASALEARFTLTEKKFAVQVLDPAEGEAYLPLELPGAEGNFVQGIREQVDQLVQEIVNQCC